MFISVRAVNSEEYENKFPEPPNFRKIYQSPIVGLDNFWNLWVNEHKQAVINVRGTTQKPESWLENVYAVDWVPQTPFSIQTTDDFNTDNPFVDAKKAIKKQKFPTRLALKHVYKKLDKPTKKSTEKLPNLLG